jgi:hypothetical protein
MFLKKPSTSVKRYTSGTSYSKTAIHSQCITYPAQIITIRIINSNTIFVLSLAVESFPFLCGRRGVMQNPATYKENEKNGVFVLIIKSNDLSPNLSFYPLLSFHKEGNESRETEKSSHKRESIN